MNRYGFRTVERVSKKKAESLYCSGKQVMFIPCKMNPENEFFSLGVWIDPSVKEDGRSFDALVNEFEYYNCNSETGRYTAFYAKKSNTDTKEVSR